jgi:hypothetical protein
MSGLGKFFDGLWVLLLFGAGAIAIHVGIRSKTSQTVEIVSYRAAVESQSKAEALRFISNFGSSYLVGNLIFSLKPEVAEQVCAELQGGGPRETRKACGVDCSALYNGHQDWAHCRHCDGQPGIGRCSGCRV